MVSGMFNRVANRGNLLSSSICWTHCSCWKTFVCQQIWIEQWQGTWLLSSLSGPSKWISFIHHKPLDSPAPPCEALELFGCCLHLMAASPVSIDAPLLNCWANQNESGPVTWYLAINKQSRWRFFCSLYNSSSSSRKQFEFINTHLQCNRASNWANRALDCIVRIWQSLGPGDGPLDCSFN